MLSQTFTWCFSVQFSHSVVSDSLRPHGLRHTRPPCPSPAPGVYPNSCPLSRWCHPTISSSVAPFSSHHQSFPWCFSEATKGNTWFKWEKGRKKTWGPGNKGTLREEKKRRGFFKNIYPWEENGLARLCIKFDKVEQCTKMCLIELFEVWEDIISKQMNEQTKKEAINNSRWSNFVKESYVCVLYLGFIYI